MSKRIMILAGEASGDLQGAHLAQTIKTIMPTYTFTGVGGPRMKVTGVDLFHDSSSWGIIGPWHAIRKIPFLLELVRSLKQTILRERPDLLILIDSPAINMRLARFAREHGIRTLYFFPPSAWYPSVKRVKRIAESVDHIVPAFSYSVKTYDDAGIKVHYFGHPLIDMLDAKSPRDDALKRLGLNEGNYVGILPGSREQEVNALMPVLLECMKSLKSRRRDIEFLLPIATPALRPLISRFFRHNEDLARLVDGSAHEVMKVSRLIVMASGSSSLEAAILGTPMIILYKLAWPDWCIGKLFIKVPFIALPNLIVQRKVVSELIQLEASPERIVLESMELLEDTETREQMLKDLREVKDSLGEPGVLKRLGSFIVDVCEGSPAPERSLKEVGFAL
jgi:lipid-A-disaccharide synthase